MGYFIHSYGKLVSVGNKSVCISSEGTGLDVIVLLAGISSPSPVLEMKALSSFLKETYTVITIEYLGHGLSDQPDSARTIENITGEVHSTISQLDEFVEAIHKTISQLGYARYYLVAHSMSGIYSLYYANKYPNEVRAFIGIDATIPKQNDNRQFVEKIISSAKKNYRRQKSGLWWWITNLTARRRLRKGKGYLYTKDEIYDYGLLAALQMSSEYVLSEYMYIDDNCNRMRNIHFPSHIPILYILSQESEKQYPNWYKLHKELLGKNKGRIVSLKGGHYLHIALPEKVAEEIKSFISLNGT